MKALVNSKKKFVKWSKGNWIETDVPVLYDDHLVESDFDSKNIKGLKLVELDVFIDKPKPRYVIAKK